MCSRKIIMKRGPQSTYHKEKELINSTILKLIMAVYQKIPQR